MHKQNDLATGLGNHVPHARELVFSCKTTQQPARSSTCLTSIFFYLFIDYKHKHTALASWIYALHLPPPPTFLIDYKHKRANALYV